MSTPTSSAESLRSLWRLFQLASPALPVGAYAYSQGLEYAVHAGWVHDESSALDWLRGLASHAVGTLDLPILLRLHRAWGRHDRTDICKWNARLLAARETSELRAEERQLGQALSRVLTELEVPHEFFGPGESVAFVTLFGCAAAHWDIGQQATLAGYLWAWSENQVLAAIKLVPLGQSAGQRILHRLTAGLPDIINHCVTVADEEIGISVLSQAVASALHETQYTRLFRS